MNLMITCCTNNGPQQRVASISIGVGAFIEDVLYDFFGVGFSTIHAYVGSNISLLICCFRSECRSKS